jgi:MFS family permease
MCVTSPVIGAFLATRKGWRWTQWTILFFLAFCLIITVTIGRETYHPVLMRRRAKQRKVPGLC